MDIATVVSCIAGTNEITLKQKALILLRFALNEKSVAFIEKGIDFIDSLYGGYSADEFCSIILNSMNDTALGSKHEQADLTDIMVSIIRAILNRCHCSTCFDNIHVVVGIWQSSPYREAVLNFITAERNVKCTRQYSLY